MKGHKQAKHHMKRAEHHASKAKEHSAMANKVIAFMKDEKKENKGMMKKKKKY